MILGDVSLFGELIWEVKVTKCIAYVPEGID